MKFEVSERIATTKADSEVLSLLCEQFKKVAESAEIEGGKTIQVKSIEASFGSINRKDSTQISIRNDNGSCLLVAAVNYQPSVWMWLFLFVGLFLYGIGFFVPIIFFVYQKKTVKEGVESVFQRVKNELQVSSTQSSTSTIQSIAAQLKDLNQLHKEGGLTDPEFQMMKEKLLKTA